MSMHAYYNMHYLNAWKPCIAKNQYQKLETNIPRKVIARPQSQFPHKCVCERFIYSTIDLPILLQEIMWTDPGNI